MRVTLTEMPEPMTSVIAGRPAFVAGIYLAAGVGNLQAVRLLQAGLSLLLVWLLYLLGGRISAIDTGIATVSLDAGAILRLPAPAGLAAQSDVLVSVRPEQLTLSAVPGPELWRIEPGLSLPLGGQLVHEARTADGTALKIAEPRLAAAKGAPRRFCGQPLGRDQGVTGMGWAVPWAAPRLRGRTAGSWDQLAT